MTEVLARIKANIRRSTQYTSQNMERAAREEHRIARGELVINTYDWMERALALEIIYWDKILSIS